MKKYKIIYADPPWDFNNKKTGGSMKSGALSKYPTMTVEEMKQIHVNEITDENSVLFMWWVASQPKEAIELAEAWGFKIKTMTGFNWVKTTMSKSTYNIVINLQAIVSRHLPEKYSETINCLIEKASYKLHFGMGFWTRAGSEQCLIAVKGKPKRISGSVRSVCLAPIGEHSEKPHEIRERIVELMGDIPRLEMFARKNFEGWSAFGNEVDESIDL